MKFQTWPSLTKEREFDQEIEIGKSDESIEANRVMKQYKASVLQT